MRSEFSQPKTFNIFMTNAKFYMRMLYIIQCDFKKPGIKE